MAGTQDIESARVSQRVSGAILRVALRDFGPAYVGSGSWPCENVGARHASRIISKKLRIMESNRTGHVEIDALLENCIFYISPMYEFSHSLGRREDASRSSLPDTSGITRAKRRAGAQPREEEAPARRAVAAD